MLGKVLEVSCPEGATDHISLKEINMILLQPAFHLGWSSGLGTLVFSELSKFVKGRPILVAGLNPSEKY